MTEGVSDTQVHLPALTERRPDLQAKALLRKNHLSAWQTQTERGSSQLNLFGWAAQRLILKNPGLETQIWLTRRRRVCNHLDALAAPEVLPRRRCAVLQLLRRRVEKKPKHFDFCNKSSLDSVFPCSSRGDTPLNGARTNRSIKLFTEMPSGKRLSIEPFRLEPFVFIPKTLRNQRIAQSA